MLSSDSLSLESQLSCLANARVAGDRTGMGVDVCELEAGDSAGGSFLINF